MKQPPWVVEESPSHSEPDSDFSTSEDEVEDAEMDSTAQSLENSAA
jgi:hypothetical protein